MKLTMFSMPRAMRLVRSYTTSVSPMAQARASGRLKAAKGGAAPAAEDLEDQTKQKAEALKRVMETLNKKHGKGTVMFASDWKQQGDALKTGVLTLDIALGGGWPKGRIIEVFGPESSGKTTLCMTAVKEVLRLNPNALALFVDAEHALDQKFCKTIGIDVDRLLVTKPRCGEEACDQILNFINSGTIDIIVVDSVAALIPKVELEQEFGAPTMGSHARLMSSSLKKIVIAAEHAKCTILFTNQIRNKIGVIYGSPEVTTGGKALLYYASVRVDVRRIKKLAGKVKGDDEVGIRVKSKIVKCKTAAPFKEAEFDILWATGVDEVGCIFDAGLKAGVIEAKGSHYYVAESQEKLGQGRDTVVAALKQDQEKLRHIEGLVHKAILEDKDKLTLLIPERHGTVDFDEEGNEIPDDSEEFLDETIEERSLQA